MRVIKQGKIPDVVSWWIDKEMSCCNCGTVVLLEKSDADVVKEESNAYLRRTWVEVPCPICCETIVNIKSWTSASV